MAFSHSPFSHTPFQAPPVVEIEDAPAANEAAVPVKKERKKRVRVPLDAELVCSDRGLLRLVEEIGKKMKYHGPGKEVAAAVSF